MSDANPVDLIYGKSLSNGDTESVQENQIRSALTKEYMQSLSAGLHELARPNVGGHLPETAEIISLHARDNGATKAPSGASPAEALAKVPNTEEASKISEFSQLVDDEIIGGITAYALVGHPAAALAGAVSGLVVGAAFDGLRKGHMFSKEWLADGTSNLIEDQCVGMFVSLTAAERFPGRFIGLAVGSGLGLAKATDAGLDLAGAKDIARRAISYL